MNNKGLTLTELLISTMILSIMMLALADFSLDILNVADKHSQNVEKALNNRVTNEHIIEKLHDAAYIFPKGNTINLSVESVEDGIGSYSQESIDTDDSIVMLVPPNIDEDYAYQGDTPCYNVVAYYTKTKTLSHSNLYEFSTSWPNFCWAENTIPDISSAYGTATKLSEKIQSDSIDLSLVLSQESSSTDSILKSERKGANENSTDALIKGFDLSFTQDLPEGEIDVTFTGLSRNIPRYIDEDFQ